MNKNSKTAKNIRKVASLHVHFALQIRIVQGNLTLMYSKSLRFFLYNKKVVMGNKKI